MANPQHKMMAEPKSAGVVTEEQKEQSRILFRGMFPNAGPEIEQQIIDSLVPPGQPVKTVNLGFIANSHIGGDPAVLANIEANKKALAEKRAKERLAVGARGR